MFFYTMGKITKNGQPFLAFDRFSSKLLALGLGLGVRVRVSLGSV